MSTIKVKPWGEGQGDHVLIEEEDFNPDFHELLHPPKTIGGSELKFAAKHIGGGKWAVFEGETRLTETPMTKEEAHADAEAKNAAAAGQ